jgi:hypothetical protein
VVGESEEHRKRANSEKVVKKDGEKGMGNRKIEMNLNLI